MLRAETAQFGIKVIVVEPSGFRTDWAGSSMTIRPIPDDYAEILGWRREGGGVAAGDPDPAAEILVQVASVATSPQSATWGERDGGLDTARPRAPRRRPQVVSSQQVSRFRRVLPGRISPRPRRPGLIRPVRSGTDRSRPACGTGGITFNVGQHDRARTDSPGFRRADGFAASVHDVAERVERGCAADCRN